MSHQSVSSETTPGNFRWLLVGAGLLLQFSIGAVYASQGSQGSQGSQRSQRSQGSQRSRGHSAA